MDPTPQKSILLPILLSVLTTALAAGGVGYYLGIAQTPAPTATPTTIAKVFPSPKVSPSPSSSASTSPASTIDEIANWKTYTSTKYGYSIKYPSDWIDAGKEYKSGATDLVLHSPSTVKAFNSPNATETTSDFTVSYYESSQKLIVNGPKESGAKSLLDYLKTEKAKQEIVLDYEEAKIGAYNGYKVEQSNIGGIEYYYLEKNGHVYKFTLDSNAAILKQILSTLNFTK